MTLVLKSNVKMKTGNLKSKIALEPVVAADFVGETYLANGKNVGINDVVTVTNNRYAGKLDAFGNYSEVSSISTPVIGFDPSKLKKGLQIDADSENFFTNGKSNPQSFSREMVIFAGHALTLNVIGSGSATMKVAGVSVGTAKENNPVTYKSASPSTVTVTVTVDVSGSIVFGALYRTADARLNRGRYQDNIKYSADKVSIKTDLLKLLQNTQGCLVIKNIYPDQVFDRSLTLTQTYLLAQFIDGSAGSQAKGLSVGFRENNIVKYLVRGYDTEERVSSYNNNVIPSSNKKSNIIAINFSKTGLKLAVNGEVLGTHQISPVDINEINIASGYWGATTPQLIESYMLYDRELTNDEMIAVTK